MNKEINELTEWFIASEHVVLSDSIHKEITRECSMKGIEIGVLQRNEGVLKMLFNDSLSLNIRVKIADYILSNYSEKPFRIPTDVVADTRRKLIFQMSR